MSVEIYDSGIGFAIPAWDLLSLVGRLEGGVVLTAGFLGVVPDAGHRGGGVRIEGVAPGSPAAQAGLQEGDVIVTLGALQETTLIEFQWSFSEIPVFSASAFRPFDVAATLINPSVVRTPAFRSRVALFGSMPSTSPMVAMTFSPLFRQPFRR